MIARFEALPLTVPVDQPRDGARSRSELLRLGVSDAQIDKLIARRIVAEQCGGGSYLSE